MIVFEDWSDEAYPADWYNLYRSWKTLTLKLRELSVI